MLQKIRETSKIIIFLFLLGIIFTIGIFAVRAVNDRGREPAAWLKFDEGYGTTAYDSVGSNDGTMQGSTSTMWKNEPACKFGKCLYLDGSGDYVEIPTFDLN